MRTYARIDKAAPGVDAGGTVAELLTTDQDITHLFHPSLHWVDVTGKQVEVGWAMTATGFSPPPAAAPGPPAQAQLAELTARVAKLAPQA